MACEISFLPVGNADCIVIHADDSVVIVDLGKKSRFIYNWLKQKNLGKVNRIYITHNHNDHFPFPSLKQLVDFLELWFSQGGEIETFSLPLGIYTDACTKLDNIEKTDILRHQELKDAIDRLDDWDRSNKISLVPAFRDPTPYTLADLQIYTLHPRQIFTEKHKGKINEISLVLRVVYGNFSAILLSDLEGKGLKDYLSVVKASDSRTPETRANIVKIPHHGGYPTNGDDLKELLAEINPELAILSVGSNNPFGHVVPELFQALIELQNNSTHSTRRLKQFICTEVTRTCVHSKVERSSMGKSGKSGLSTPQKCAGEITIIANNLGEWQLKTEATDHSAKIASLSHAACDGRADIG
jgi:beta-lactamase superfamily II metal-dependent hydrolase